MSHESRLELIKKIVLRPKKRRFKDEHPKWFKSTDVIGEKNVSAKLTEKDVLDIRALSLTSSRSEIAKKYNVSKSEVGRVITGESWGHIKDGIRQPNKRTKLSHEDILKIRSFSGSMSNNEIAKMFSVGRVHVGRIIRRERRKNI